MYRMILNSIKFVKGILYDDFKTICLKQYIIHTEIYLCTYIIL